MGANEGKGVNATSAVVVIEELYDLATSDGNTTNKPLQFPLSGRHILPFANGKATPSSAASHAKQLNYNDDVNLDNITVSFAQQGDDERSSDPDLLPSRAKSPLSAPKPFAGTLDAINCGNSLSIHPSQRNTELLYLCKLSTAANKHTTNRILQDNKAVAPLMASLDGQDTPVSFQKVVFPLIMQSPLSPQIGILTASGFRALLRGQEVTTCQETMIIKGMVLSHINDFLKEDFEKIHHEAIQSVSQLALLEVSEIESAYAKMDANTDFLDA